LVNLGLGELFVAIKGMLIVVGSFYVQNGHIIMESFLVGVITGLLSSLVLYVNSIPDVKADKDHGRRTLAIIFENFLWYKRFLLILFFFALIYILTFVLYYSLINNLYLFIVNIFLIPLSTSIINDFYHFLKYSKEINEFYEKIMGKTILFSRLYGVSISIGFLILIIFNFKK
jgi:1,4-dihydroxy-2-naphthoate octaprenyltransferase